MRTIAHPPQNLPQITHRQRLRFSWSGATDASPGLISFQDLCDSIWVAATATTGFQLFDYVRINSVDLYASSGSSSPASVCCIFSGTTTGVLGSGEAKQDTAVATDVAHVHAVPSKRSLASMWQAGSTNSVCMRLSSYSNAAATKVALPCVVDVDLSFKMSDLVAAQAVANAPSGATAGEVYYRSLDGTAGNSGPFVPLGMANVG